MTSQVPPIVKLAERALVEIEQVVRCFPRYHKYAVGAELRAQAREVAQLAIRAWRDSKQQFNCINALTVEIDNLKLSIQIAKQLHAFKSFAQFEALARLVSDLGRQCGGWRKQLHQKGQNDAAMVPQQRSQILSAHGASTKANL